MVKPYYCEFCNRELVPDEYGVYTHNETYHYDQYNYDTQPGTCHAVPFNRLDLRH